MNAANPPARRLGPYELIGSLGAGGMGEVWLARDPRLQREVALKLLPQRLATDRDALALFRNEALALASLNHPNIAIIHGLEEIPNGPLVLVLERVEGESLATRLTRGALAPDEALQVGVQIAQALEAAHERGVVHRDLKPANVMMAPRGLVKVLDFGIAKRTYGLANPSPSAAAPPPPDADASASRSGPVAGTPGYMSPEQVLAGDQGPRTDLFALGCVLYECLTGVRAFPADDAFVAMAQVLNDTPDLEALPARLSPEVRHTIGSCLAKDAEARPDSALTVRHALEEALGIRRASQLREGGAYTVPHNLPVPATTFIGREATLAECAEALDATRLLTLTGIGGSGKTRLALELARQHLDRFPDGVWFVDVAPLTDENRLPETLAAALGVRDEPGRSALDGVLGHLRTRRALILLDNSESFPEASAALVAALLAGCPDVKLLVTDRQPLGVEGEHLYLVPTLGLPPARTRTASAANASEAVRLFVERARAASPAFELTDANATHVAEVCRHLDGIPLALELAAARVRLLSVEQIRARLGDRFKLLARSGSGAPSRQQTVLAVIQWSWDHLHEPEQALMRRLAVFTGGWTLERAIEVCSDSGDEFEVLDLLTRLVERSLVVAHGTSGQTGYHFLESVWRFALDRLEGHLEHESMRERHLRAYERFAGSLEKRLTNADVETALREFSNEQENLMTAAIWCAQAEDGVQRGMALVSAAYRGWLLRGQYTLARRLFADVLARDTARTPTPARAKALVRASAFALVLGDHASAEPYLRESLEISSLLGDHKAMARALAGLGTTAFYLGRHEDALAIGEQSLALYTQLGEERGVALAEHNQGSILAGLQRHKEATPYLERAVERLHRLGDGTAEALSRAALADSRLQMGDLAGCRSELLAGLDILHRLESTREASYLLTVLADLALVHNRAEEAARMLGTALAFRASTSMTLTPDEEREEARIVSGLERSIGAAALQEAFRSVAGATWGSMMSEAGALLESLPGA